ncbi:MAG TPA: hypothetical protein DEP45_13240 [Armatimonadetes bacterium]|nr:hypothetical protein [Armatimonadota bacterium]
MPGWTRGHYLAVLSLIVVFGMLARTAPPEDGVADPVSSDRYRPVAAAIGLTTEVPNDAALATWMNSALYGAGYCLRTLLAPGTSCIDFCASFLRDPQRFCAPASLAALLACSLSAILASLLVKRLMDPVAGIAAAFLIALHPASIAFTSGIGSGAFSLLFLICGLLVAATLNWREPAIPAVVAIGLCLGFALDAIILAAPLFILVMILGWRAMPDHGRLRRCGEFALALAAFTWAGAAVIPEAVAAAKALQILGLSAAIALLLAVATHALRSYRLIVGDRAYSSTLLGVTVVIGIVGLLRAPQTPLEANEAPASLAALWLITNAPGDSTIVVDTRLCDAVALPRSERSWHRQLMASQDAPRQLRLHALAAARAAAQLPGPSFDVVFSPAGPAHQAPSQPRLRATPDYIVLPDGADMAEFEPTRPWLVARFRSRSTDEPGVTIWGTEASPEAEPVHVEWRYQSGHRIACAGLPE